MTQVSTATGIARSTLQKWENNEEADVLMGKFQTLAAFFGYEGRNWVKLLASEQTEADIGRTEQGEALANALKSALPASMLEAMLSTLSGAAS